MNKMFLVAFFFMFYVLTVKEDVCACNIIILLCLSSSLWWRRCSYAVVYGWIYVWVVCMYLLHFILFMAKVWISILKASSAHRILFAHKPLLYIHTYKLYMVYIYEYQSFHEAKYCHIVIRETEIERGRE